MKRMLIYNPLTGHGHLNYYNETLCKIFLKDFKVINSTDEKNYFNKKIYSKNKKKNLIFIEKNRPIKFSNNAELSKNKVFSIKQIYLLVKSILNKNKFLKKYLSPILEKIKFYYFYFLNQKNVKNDFFFSVRELNQNLNYIIEKFSINNQLILITYMDQFSRSKKDWKKFKLINNCKLISMFFHIDNKTKKFKNFFSSNDHIGSIFSSESQKKNVEKMKIANKKFFYLPVLNNKNLKRNKLIDNLKKKIKKRKIIFLGGSISSIKNIDLFHDIYFSGKFDDCFFLVVGNFHPGTFSDREFQSYKAFKNIKSDNFYIFDQYIESDEEFNYILKKVDIIFSVNKHKNVSSGLVVKAKYFNKKIIVNKLNSDQAYIVNKYNIGSSVLYKSKKDTQKVIRALRKLIGKKQNSKKNAEFKKKFSNKTFYKDFLKGPYNYFLSKIN